MDLQQIIDQICKIPATSALKLQNVIKLVALPKGHLLFKAGKTETDIYYIKKGIARAYLYQNNNEITFWFGREGDAVISMRSYVENKPGYENIELLEDCELYHIKAHDLQQLFDHDIHVANWGRKFAEHELVRTEERLISRQFGTAAVRYKELLENNPGLLQRVQLGYIASYLGITQVSLSRIRAEIR